MNCKKNHNFGANESKVSTVTYVLAVLGRPYDGSAPVVAVDLLQPAVAVPEGFDLLHEVLPVWRLRRSFLERFHLDLSVFI